MRGGDPAERRRGGRQPTRGSRAWAMRGFDSLDGAGLRRSGRRPSAGRRASGHALRARDGRAARGRAPSGRARTADRQSARSIRPTRSTAATITSSSSHSYPVLPGSTISGAEPLERPAPACRRASASAITNPKGSGRWISSSGSSRGAPPGRSRRVRPAPRWPNVLLSRGQRHQHDRNVGFQHGAPNSLGAAGIQPPGPAQCDQVDAFGGRHVDNLLAGRPTP